MSRKKRCHLPASATFNNSWPGFGLVILSDRGHLDSTQGMRVTPLKTNTVLPLCPAISTMFTGKIVFQIPFCGYFFWLFKEMIKNHRRSSNPWQRGSPIFTGFTFGKNMKVSWDYDIPNMEKYGKIYISKCSTSPTSNFPLCHHVCDPQVRLNDHLCLPKCSTSPRSNLWSATPRIMIPFRQVVTGALL